MSRFCYFEFCCKEFTPANRGIPQRFCSPQCRIKHHESENFAIRRRQKKLAGRRWYARHRLTLLPRLRREYAARIL
jgi:hypothetical protein